MRNGGFPPNDPMAVRAVPERTRLLVAERRQRARELAHGVAVAAAPTRFDPALERRARLRALAEREQHVARVQVRRRVVGMIAHQNVELGARLRELARVLVLLRKAVARERIARMRRDELLQ